MLFGVGTSYIGNSNTLAVVDGLLLHRGRRVTSLTDVVYVACRGIKVITVSSAGAQSPAAQAKPKALEDDDDVSE